MTQKLEMLSGSSFGDYLLSGQINLSGDNHYIWDYSPEVSCPSKLKTYLSYFHATDWKLTEDPNMDIDISYWYFDKSNGEIRLSKMLKHSEYRSIEDGEQSKNYPAILVKQI